MARLFWRSDSSTVSVGPTADGGLQFSGHDLRAFGTPGHEYEYVVVVPASQLAALRRVLGIDDEADVVSAVVSSVDDIMPTGEVAWLTRHGIAHEVSVWDHPPG